jgi:hypothetical protein
MKRRDLETSIGPKLFMQRRRSVAAFAMQEYGV